MNLLVTYNPAKETDDPKFDEFTYGDWGKRGRELKRKIAKGDYIFFHTNIAGKKAITAYYVVDRIMMVEDVAKDEDLKAKFRNPHLMRYLKERTPKENDVIVFGDPITSRLLRKPVFLDRELVDKLSLDIKFPRGRTETQAIGSATRAFRELTATDKALLLRRIEKAEVRFDPSTLTSTEEVTEIIEKDVENFLAANPRIITEALGIQSGTRILGRQRSTEVGRPDLIIEFEDDSLAVIEIKLGKAGRDALNQIKRYVKEIRSKHKGKVKGILVCSGVMPAFEEEFGKQKDISILLYGWKIAVKTFPG
jgi:hypothetical protein